MARMTILIDLKPFQNLGSGLRARRKPMKKRSIHFRVCEHFEEACNTAVRPQTGF